MLQAEMDFGVFATPSSNWARRKHRPLPPDADGLFDAEAVTVICGRRQCFFDVAGDLFGHVQFKETRIPLTAIAPGRWDPVAVLAACTRAHGNQVCEVDYATAKPSNPDGLDEIKIARAWAPTACGRTYRKRAVFRGPVWCVASVERPLETEDGFRNTFRASAGKPTWAFRTLLSDRRGPRTSDYRVRRALRALEDVGLMRIELGPRRHGDREVHMDGPSVPAAGVPRPRRRGGHGDAGVRFRS